MADQLANQPTKMPTKKWLAGGSAGGGTLVLLWVGRSLGVDIPPEVGEALVLGAGLAAAWLKRNAPALADRLDGGRGKHFDNDGDGLADR